MSHLLKNNKELFIDTSRNCLTVLSHILNYNEKLVIKSKLNSLS